LEFVSYFEFRASHFDRCPPTGAAAEMSTAFVTTRRVEFSDTDAAGIMHFVAFFRMMEQAEHDLLRSVGLSVVIPDDQGHLSWPRVSAACDFQSVAHFEDVLEIEVRIARLGEKSVTYNHTFRCGEQTLATGQVIAVCCRIRASAPPEAIPIPDHIASKLRPFAGGNSP
jgi:4-hydroxybenzoyl-CoA thioesterase/acyl-CoA thioester hydrolase